MSDWVCIAGEPIEFELVSHMQNTKTGEQRVVSCLHVESGYVYKVNSMSNTGVWTETALFVPSKEPKSKGSK